VLFRRLFSKTRPLTGAPAIRRLKTYTAESGYVYHYYYEGHREFHRGREKGTEFVFSISADRKTWNNLGVLVADATIEGWEQSHARELSSTERYAVAKMTLFQAFDTRETPAQMNSDINVSPADVDALVEKLGL
jgi:hypothetical protein